MEEIQSGPQASVVIVSYNSAGALRRCLEAIERSYERERIEVVAVDCGSRDNTAELEADFANIRLLRLPKYFGLTKARNIGMRTATAELILFLSPDIELEPSAMAALVSAMDEDPNTWAAVPFVTTPSGEPANVVRPLPTAQSPTAGWSIDAPLTASVTGGDALVDGCPSLDALMLRRHFLKGMNYLNEKMGELWPEAEIGYQIKFAGKTIRAVHGARATRHGDAYRLPLEDASVRATVTADRMLGASAYAGRHFGWSAGFGQAAGAVLGAAGRMLTFREPGYNFKLLTMLIGGQRIDGNQQAF